MGYFRETVKGVSWVGALRGSTRMIAFVKIIILARILSPSQFGLFGIAILVLALLEILTETGINVFLLQKRQDINGYIDTAWVVSIIRGILIALVILVLSPLVAMFFRTPGARTLLILISLVPFIRGFINPSVVKFQKELRFERDFAYRLFVFGFDAGVAILVAIYTGLAISLIVGMVAGALLEAALSFMMAKPRPKFMFDRSRAAEVIRRGKWVMGAGFFQYLFREGDDVVVGRILGSSQLGLYQMAYKIATLPISEVADVFGKVTLPVYVKIASDRKRLMRAYIRTTLTVSALAVSFGLVLILFSDEVVLVVLGEKWLAASPVLRVVAIYAMLRSVINPSLTLFLAMEKQEYMMAVTLAGILGMGLSIIPLVYHYGIVGAGVSTVIGFGAAGPLVIYYLMKLFSLREK